MTILERLKQKIKAKRNEEAGGESVYIEILLSDAEAIRDALEASHYYLDGGLFNIRWDSFQGTVRYVAEVDIARDED